MEWDELKQEIGERAKQIIIDDRCSGQERPICFITDHSSSPVLDWSGDALHFRCHNCGQYWDVIDHVRWLAHDDNARAYELLCEYAGVESGGKAPPKAAGKMQTTPPPLQITHEQPPLKEVEILSKRLFPSAKQYLEGRGISDETLLLYKVTSTRAAIYFNYVVDGKVVKIKGRLIGDMANGREKWSPTPRGGTNVLYGQHTRKSQRILAVCEGEIDALSLYEGMKACNLDKEVCCTSIPTGSADVSWINNSRAFIDSFEKVILIPDNDDAGAKFLDKAAAELLLVKPVSSFPLDDYDVNDVNELLQKHGGKVMGALIGQCERYLPDFAVDLKNLPEETTEDYSKTGFYMLDKPLRGLKPGLMTLFTGKAGKGKTTIIRQVVNHQISSQRRVGVLMGEEEAQVFRRFILRQYYGKSHPQYFEKIYDEWGNVDYNPKPELLAMFTDYFADWISFFDCGHLESKEKLLKLYEWIRFESTIFGTKLFIIDNLMRLEAGVSGKDIGDVQGDIITSLKSICGVARVHMILIAHPRKEADTNFITQNSIRGSGKLVDTIDNLVVFQRMDEFDSTETGKLWGIFKKMGEYNIVTGFMRVLKNRMYGEEPFIPMRYNDKSNTIHDLNPKNNFTYGYGIPARFIKDKDVPDDNNQEQEESES
jgi:hypothetical protein